MIGVENRLEQAGSELRVGVGGMDVPEAPSIRRRHFRQRAVTWLSSVVLLLGALGAAALLTSPGSLTDSATDPTEAPSETIAPTASILNSTDVVLAVEDITYLVNNYTASSEYSDLYRTALLWDGDNATSWQDASLEGVGAWFEIQFSTPVAIDHIVFSPLADEAGFARNFKVEAYTITADDLDDPVVGSLANDPNPQTIDIDSTWTRVFRFSVDTTYPGVATEDGPPFSELAIGDIALFGHVATDFAGDVSDSPDIVADSPADLPRFTIGLPGWYTYMATGSESFLVTSFETEDPDSPAHLADIEIWSNNSQYEGFTSYDEYVDVALTEGEHLGTVTLANGETAESFYYPDPGLYYTFVWQHSDSVWVIARIQTSKPGENSRTGAFDRAKRIVDSIEPISLDLWSRLVADSPNGYSVNEQFGAGIGPDESP